MHYLVLENFPDFEYELTQSVSLGEIQQSKLFPKGDYLLKGNSLLKDRTRGTSISNLRITRNEDKDSKPANVFEGLFVKIQINQAIDQPIFITPKPDFYKTNIPSFLQKLVHPPFPVERKVFIKQNDHFNSKYDVYSFSQLDINDVINPELMEGILNLNQLLNQFSFSKTKEDKTGIFGHDRKISCELEFSIVDQFFFIGIKGFQIFEFNWRQSKKDLTNYCNHCLDVLKIVDKSQTDQKK